jgi:molybdopterin converting factor small subunit
MIVTFYGGITRYTNGDKSYTPKVHNTLRGLLEELGDYYGEMFVTFVTGNEACIILINGKGIMLSGGLDSMINPGDKIELLPFVDAG